MTLTLRSLALLLVLLPVWPAAAQEGPRAAAKADKAVQALQAYTEGVRKAGHRPDYTSAPAAELLHTIFDADRLMAMPQISSRDLDWLMDWGQAANRGYKQIILFGVPPGHEPDEATLARNLGDYEDQIAPALSFQLRMLARTMDASAMFLSELPEKDVTPVRMAGFRKALAFNGQFLQAALCTAQSFRPGNVRMLIKAIHETRATWIEALYPEDKTKAAQMLKEIISRVSDKEVADSAAALVTAFAEEK